ncbi:hypothetical protein [Sorangium atrum]|uniref:Response regulatory domain-containing protein n=1 Tax=Sorangium atrum TaxID=2995308 RepID=A0ABT5C5I4_9BACT|nr:hypothetical protein [Sorangium aterium]MDC0681690.1 hypothetical protein [Sorangium aterium]
MPRISDATLRAQIPTALLIGGDQALLQRCQTAAMDVGIIVKACPVSMAAALAEERRPVVIVVTSSTYALAPEAFEEIARDVVSTLVRVDEAMVEDELGAMLATAARESRKQRSRQQTPGRYSMMPADEGASVPRSERMTIGVMKAAPSSRRDPEATPLPRSGPRSAGAQEPRSAGAQELAYRERVAAAVAAQRPERSRAEAPGEAAYRAREAPVPRSERLGVMVGPPSSRARRELPAPTPLPPPPAAGPVVARRDASAPPSVRGGAHARRDVPVQASPAAGAYVRRDTPLAGSHPVEAYVRRDTPVAGSQQAGAYAHREAPAATSARRETSAQQAVPSSRQQAGVAPRRDTPAAHALPRQVPPSPAAQPWEQRDLQPWEQRDAQPWEQRDAQPWEENIGPQPGAASPQRDVLAMGSQDGEAHRGHSAPSPSSHRAPPSSHRAPPSSHQAPPSSHQAPPSSRRAQFHVDIALLFDERGLPRADPQAK